MSLGSDQLQQLAETAILAAKAAGAVINAYRRQAIQVEHKARGTSLASQVVTQADREAQTAILDVLRPSCTDFDLGLLTEESPDSGDRLIKPAFWSIDPLDGTLAFINNSPGFSVSIALVARSGEPLIGVVYDPVADTLFKAVRGQGVLVDGCPMVIPPLDDARPLLLHTDASFQQHPWFNATRDGLQHCATALGLPGADIRLTTGAVLMACTVLTTANSCYFKYPRRGDSGGSLWDYAATAALFHEAGAIASDIHGQPMALNRADATFMNHRGILFATSAPLADCIMAMYRQLRSQHPINHSARRNE